MSEVKYFISILGRNVSPYGKKCIVKILICSKKKNLRFACGNSSIVISHVTVHPLNVSVISVKKV